MRSTGVVLASIALAATITVDAKVVRTTLEELVNKSELVLYGVTTRHDDGQSIVWFKADCC